MRVRDAPASFVVILTVSRYGGTRDEGETRVERGLKRGKGPRLPTLHRRGLHDKHNIFSVREMYAYRPEKYAYYAKAYELYKSSLMKGKRIFRLRSVVDGTDGGGGGCGISPWAKNSAHFLRGAARPLLRDAAR